MADGQEKKKDEKEVLGVNFDTDDFDIPKQPLKLTQEEQWAAMKAKEAAEEKMKQTMESWAKNADRIKNIKSIRLNEAKAAIKQNLEGKISLGQFVKATSGIYGFWGSIWAKWTMKRNSKVMNQLYEIDELLEANRLDMEEEKEREANFQKDMQEKDALKDPDKKESVIDETGDLAHHEATGRGYRFQGAKAENLEKLDSEKKLSGFKQDVYLRARGDLNVRRTELQHLKQEYSAKIYETRRFAAVQQAMTKSFEDKDFDAILSTREEIESYEATLHDYYYDEIADNDRLKAIEETRTKLRKQLDEYKNAVSENDQSYKQGKKLFEEAQQAYDLVYPLYNEYMERVERGELKIADLEGEELTRFKNIEERFNRTSESLQKIAPFHKKNARKMENAELQINNLQAQLDSYDKEERQIHERAAERDKSRNEIREKLDAAKLTDEDYKKNIVDYDKILDAQRQMKNLDRQLEELGRLEQNLERDVLNSDVSDFMVENFTDSKVRGVAINGKIYLDRDRLEEKGLPRDSKPDAKDSARISEMQKIVRALKSRPFFKFVNGVNLGEYAAFNEKTGQFDLYKGDIKDTQAKAQFDLDFLTANYLDSNVFTNHLINESPEKFAGYMIASSVTGALKEFKDTVIKASKNIPAIAAKALTDIPLFGVFFEGEDEESYVEAGSSTRRIEEGVDLCFKAMGKLAGKEKFVASKTLSDSIADMKAIQALMELDVISPKMGFSVKDIGSYVMAIEKSARIIHTANGAITEQTRLAEEMLKAGHKRFQSIMTSALQKTKSDKAEAVIDLTTNLVVASTHIATGIDKSLLSRAAGIAGGAAKFIHGIVAGKKNMDEILNTPEILGGIQYDKNLISDAAFDRILHSVVGVNSKEDLLKAMKVVDAIDMVRAAKDYKNNPNADIAKELSGLGFKDASKFNKITVGDILSRTLSKEKVNARTVLRNSVETEGFHFTSFVKKIWHSIFGTRSGEDNIKRTRREENLHKQNKALREKKTEREIRQARGAEKLYKLYMARIQKSDGKDLKGVDLIIDPRNEKPLLSETKGQGIEKLFSLSPEAMVITDALAPILSPEQTDRLLDSAIASANVSLMKSLNMNDAQIQQKQAERNRIRHPEKNNELKPIKDNLAL